MRDSLAPVLKKLYENESLPDVLEGEDSSADKTRPYTLSPGVLAQIRLDAGLTPESRVRAIVIATAEADAWLNRDKARRNFAEHVQRVKNSFGAETRDQILKIYGDLRLLQFFSSPEAEAAIAELPADVKATVESMRSEYTAAKDEIWQRWMDLKLMARREVAGDVPFRPLLKQIKEQLGKTEPAPIKFADAHDASLSGWAKAVQDDPKLFELLTNLSDLADRQEFIDDTHTLWLIEGSDRIPKEVERAQVDPDLGFIAHRRDLGSGYNEITFIFPKKLSGDALKRAYLRSHLYRQVFSDFQLLASSGPDFEAGVVPDKYDPEYAVCASKASLDAMIAAHAGTVAFLSGLRPEMKDENARLKAAHDCLLERCKPEIKHPPKDDPMDVEGPAPASRVALFAMLARFDMGGVDTDAMRVEREKSKEVLDAEAFLKANPNKQE